MPPDEWSSAGTLRTVLLGIVRYFVDHPEAKDTVTGIAEWWKPATDAPWTVPDVRAALEVLTARAWVTVRTGGDGVHLYGANPERLDEIALFLRQPRGDSNEEE